MVTGFCEMIDWEGKSYTGILKPSVPWDASYWSSIHHHPNVYRDWGHGSAGPPQTTLMESSH